MEPMDNSYLIDLYIDWMGATYNMPADEYMGMTIEEFRAWLRNTEEFVKLQAAVREWMEETGTHVGDYF